MVITQNLNPLARHGNWTTRKALGLVTLSSVLAWLGLVGLLIAILHLSA